MRKLLFVAMALMLGSCTKDLGITMTSIRKVDGCEYVVAGTYFSNNVKLVHKTGCDNPKHKTYYPKEKVWR